MRLIGLVLLLLSSATCGQEGPLYVPEEPNPAVGYLADPPIAAHSTN